MNITWGLFAVYAVATALLAILARRNTGSAAGFAIGSGQMSPWVVGVTLGATLASAATFVLFPGFVYADGLAALLGFSLPLIAGLATGLVLFAPRFQDFGAGAEALTVPHWLGSRYQDLRLRQLFAGLQILNVAYLVLIVVGCGYVMEAALGLSYHTAIISTVLFVFGYTALGGATAHAFTNTLQGLMMLVVSVTVFASGLEHWSATWESLGQSGLTAPESPLFSTLWEVIGVQFLIGLALTVQPQLLSKALYVRGRRDLWITVTVGMVTYSLFALMLFAGAYARVVLPEGVAQDRVVAEYLQVAFDWPVIGAAVSVAILAASMSTLDGLLVAVAASVGNDLLPGRGNVTINRIALAVLALATIWISWSPPKLVLLLGQIGVFGLAAASIGPLVVGLVTRRSLPSWSAWVGAISALIVHFALALTVVDNPGIAAVAGMAVGLPLSALGLLAPEARR